MVDKPLAILDAAFIPAGTGEVEDPTRGPLPG